MKKYINLLLHSVALLAIVILIATHFEYDGWLTIVFGILAIIAGYWFGQWTCHVHKKHKGFWITIGLFVLLNFMHSMVDGASVGQADSFFGAIALLSHEFARQPALYVVLWGMLTPFVFKRSYRMLLVPVMVTGVWLLGVYGGHGLAIYVDQISWLELVADQALFLFLGDILHHIFEEYGKLKKQGRCCHD